MCNRLDVLKKLIDEQRQLLLILGSNRRKDSFTSQLIVEKSQELDELIIEYLQLKAEQQGKHFSRNVQATRKSR